MPTPLFPGQITRSGEPGNLQASRRRWLVLSTSGSSTERWGDTCFARPRSILARRWRTSFARKARRNRRACSDLVSDRVEAVVGGGAIDPLSLGTAMKEGLLGDALRVSIEERVQGGPSSMLHAGLDLSRNRIDVCLLAEGGELVAEFATPSDGDGVAGLARRVLELGEPVRGVIESMTGARFVHDTLERFGWDVLIADAQKVKGLAPLACKTDKIDARVLAVLCERDLVPQI